MAAGCSLIRSLSWTQTHQPHKQAPQSSPKQRTCQVTARQPTSKHLRILPNLRICGRIRHEREQVLHGQSQGRRPARASTRASPSPSPSPSTTKTSHQTISSPSVTKTFGAVTSTLQHTKVQEAAQPAALLLHCPQKLATPARPPPAQRHSRVMMSANYHLFVWAAPNLSILCLLVRSRRSGACQPAQLNLASPSLSSHA